jgi:hypothetical protein
MAKKLQLTIPEPCHENWDSMTPAEQGRFCMSCQKQVIDFTNMSDRQLATFFKKSSTGSLCGRFYQDQLEKDIEIPRKRIPWVKYFFQFALPAFLMSTKASAQGKVRVTGDTVVVPVQTNVTLGMIAPKCKTGQTSEALIGKVVDEHNNPLPYASIMVKGTSIGAAADSSGVFKLDKVLFKKNKNIVLEISSTGFETKEIIIAEETDLVQDLIIQLVANRALQEVVVVAYPHLRGNVKVTRSVSTVLGGVISGITCKKEKETQNDKTFVPMIKIYPNPVLSGTSINLGCEKLKEGYYNIQLFNQSGQQIFNKQTWIDAEAQVLNIDIPSIASGNYFLRLTNKETGKNFTEKIIIE